MPLRTLVVLSVLTFSFTVAGACNHPSSSVTPTGPSSSSIGPAVTAGVSTLGAGRLEKLVTMMDACDPESFNAAVGPGTCIRSGGVLFDNFLAAVQQHGSIGAWHFSPSAGTARVGDTFVAKNNGGEVHTFTEVKEFGGGILPLLNELSNNPNVAPECALDALEDDDFVAPGATYREEIQEAGIVKVQCCIHPWMRLEMRVSTK